jgi:hypothetical protein
MATLLNSPVRKFGIAEVEFESSGAPSRRGTVLALPFAFNDVEMHSLLGGEQFLLKTSGRNFFGGTDEQPFMVELDQSHMERFERGGEDAFYEGLKPSRMRDYERVTGAEAVRQGDIWALPLGVTWNFLNNYHRQSYLAPPKLRRGTKTVARTRHRIVGCWTSRWVRLPKDRGWVNLQGLAAEGTLRAPDHEERRLDGPHLLMRTQGIITRRGILPHGVSGGD